jgi:hypothetical protein
MQGSAKLNQVGLDGLGILPQRHALSSFRIGPAVVRGCATGACPGG